MSRIKNSKIKKLMKLVMQEVFTYAIPVKNVKPTEIYGKDWQTVVRKLALTIPVEKAHIHVSYGNDKIGPIMNFNLPALVTCPECAHHTCGKDGCYAKKEERYLGVVVARWENLGLVLRDLPKVKRELILKIAYEVFLNRHRRVPVRLVMRPHESGDFLVKGKEREYLEMWLDICEMFPMVSFYGYSKCYDLIREYAPRILKLRNFNILLSAWKGLRVPQDLIDMGFPVAYVDDGTPETQNMIPAGCFHCPATASNEFTCHQCGACERGVNVVFKKH